MSDKRYLNIINHYEGCFDLHGDTHKGMDWPNSEDAILRYNVMMDVIKPTAKEITLLDFGCGTGHLYDYLKKNDEIGSVIYTGLDISDKFIQIAKKKHPEVSFICDDILDANHSHNDYDYVIMNGVFTEKQELSFEEMWDYFKTLIEVIFNHTRKGLAFNVMSKAVDWERWDLFHLPTDLLIKFMTKQLTRNFIIRNDYGLYEYTVYLYK